MNDSTPQSNRASPMPPPAVPLARPVVHMHIPKTAGTALRTAFEQAPGGKLRVFPHYDERKVAAANRAEWDIFSGHFGFNTAQQLQGDIVTVLRHPVDRFVSVYYFWRNLYLKNIEVTRKTCFTKLYTLDEFVCLRDEVLLIEEFFNRMTWQIAYGSSTEQRKAMRDEGKTDNDILSMAVKNLETFAVVGLQSRMPDFSHAVKQRFGVSIDLRKVNVTEARPSVSDVSVATRQKIYEWSYLDIEIYEAASQIAGTR